MGDYMTLLGAEQVQTAGYTMRHAADDMQRAAVSFSDTADRLIRAMQEHAERIEQAALSRDEGGEVNPITVDLLRWTYIASVVLGGWFLLRVTMDDLRRDRRHAERGEHNADAVTWGSIVWRAIVPLLPVINTMFAFFTVCGWTMDMIDRIDRPVIRRTPK